MKILIVVDMQNDFITGSLANSSAKQIIAAMTKKIDKYLQEGYEVIYTQDTHQEDYLETQEGKLLPVEHCKQNTHGWEIHDAVRREECTVLQKNGFGSLELVGIIQAIPQVESIELVGVCTDICVITNAHILKAAFPDVPIIIDSSCCAGTSEANHLNALNAMKCTQINII